MAKKGTEINLEEERLFLEERKVKALEKIGNSLDALTIWFEEIDKAGWDERIQYYLHEFHKNFITSDDKEDESE
ncbi:hypothetical protein N9H34_01285 [bacterium]|nr:hypothetical protein [bacterium]